MSDLSSPNRADLDDQPEVATLLGRIKSALLELTALLEKCNSHWVYEDGVYRFYHQSFELYALQNETLKIVEETPLAFAGSGIEPVVWKNHY
jgi:hypothetical protein